MSASANDLFMKLGSSSSLVNSPKVTSVRSAAGTTLAVDNCNWDTTTGKVFATYQVDTSNKVISGTEIIWKGIVSGSTSIGSMTRIAGASDTGNAIDDIVELLPASAWANNLMTGILTEHGQDGKHTSITLTGNITTADSSTAILDSSSNELVKFAKTASAVNEITITNAATGNAPQSSATGGDTNIDYRIVPKGTGNVKKGTSGGSIDWWEELGRTTLGSAGDTISIASFSARKYLHFQIDLILTGATTVQMRFNNDSGANYSLRFDNNNGTAGTGSAQTSINNLFSETTAVRAVGEGYVNNVAAAQKLGMVWIQTDGGGTTSANVPAVTKLDFKWANTSAAITRIDILNSGGGDFVSGSELVVLGHD